MTHCFSRRSFLKGSAAAAAVLSSPLLPADAAFSETENGLFSPVSALCQTQYGPVRGREGENGLLCWYGIPYGAAPTGESRWTAPQEPACWHTVRDCTSPAPAAYQYTAFPLGTEDCLTLDIYSSAEAKKRPVLVYLHGSAATGSSLELPGSELVRDAGCVFVALNYRLGLFGWNCLPALTADPDATGNFALLDIARALDWVRDNIRRFGGDADNITLCGFSDGGRMAAALAGSPLFRGRFQKAVAISGGLSLADPDASARQLAERFAPLAVEDGRFADTASAAEWLLTPGADVREWLCGLEPARIAALGKPAILYADDVVLSRGARSTVPPPAAQQRLRIQRLCPGRPAARFQRGPGLCRKIRLSPLPLEQHRSRRRSAGRQCSGLAWPHRLRRGRQSDGDPGPRLLPRPAAGALLVRKQLFCLC